MLHLVRSGQYPALQRQCDTIFVVVGRDLMGMALDLRGFRSQPTRTRVVEIPQRRHEPLLRYLLLALVLLEIVWRGWP